MPGGDRTGPMGQGPMTGRRMGFCSGNEFAGNAAGAFGRQGAFRGGPGRRGGFFRHGNAGYYPAAGEMTQNRKQAIENELEYLKNQMTRLEAELKDLG
ncbi:MAG: DUF5320 domain-containing protein [Bacteroidales bacterium]|nr:DUF5320 domain-containing protein [Bacteroidales bacterium]